ncbi:MAG: DHHA1 domain-containing protein, partial [Ruminococcus sp.]|nr:DHHA1 domain-containing protein [Ruminococcus sp.]
GVGVAFKLIMALEGEDCDVNNLLDNYADLLSLGTIGDIVELRGENRVFVKRGLQSIMNSDRVGINALVQSSGLGGKNITAGNVSFTLVPRINAVGRLGLSGKSVELLLTEDYEQAEEISSELCEDNSERQQIEKEILDKIDERIQQNPSIALDKVIVIDGENWHQGVIGIVASRIKDVYGKPVIVISRMGESAKASGRSVEGFPLCDAVFACADLLTHYGGHPMAVGLSLDSENITLFRKRINEFANSFENMPFDKLNIECKLNPAFINLELAESLSYLQPFGSGNPTPVFGLYNMTLTNIIPLSNNKHLKLMFSRGNSTITAMKFFTSTDEFPYVRGDVLDLAVTLDTNEYNGTTSVSVIIKAIKANADDTEEILKSQRVYEDFYMGNTPEKEKLLSITPTRDDFALLYRFLKASTGYGFPAQTLVHKLDNKLSFGKIRVILKAMSELGLIQICEGLRGTRIKMLEVAGKVQLETADIIKRLKEVSQ